MYVEHGFEGEDNDNRMVKSLAGEYCCYADGPAQTRQELLALATQHLQTVGVILLSDRMYDSLQYLAHVLGWQVSCGCQGGG